MAHNFPFLRYFPLVINLMNSKILNISPTTSTTIHRARMAKLQRQATFADSDLKRLEAAVGIAQKLAIHVAEIYHKHTGRSWLEYAMLVLKYADNHGYHFLLLETAW